MGKRPTLKWMLVLWLAGSVLVIGRGSRAQSPSAAPDATPMTRALSAGESSPSPPWWVNRGRWSFGAQAGFAVENDLVNNISHISLLIAQPQVALIAHESSEFFVRRFELLGEGTLGYAPHPGGRLTGGLLVFRLNGRSFGLFVPFFDLGAGMLNTTLYQRAPELSGTTQFSPQGGFGVQYFLRPQRALVFECRFLHLSNANLQPPNISFNGAMFSVGFRWLRRPRPADPGRGQLN